jgi:hypothetical protein
MECGLARKCLAGLLGTVRKKWFLKAKPRYGIIV